MLGPRRRRWTSIKAAGNRYLTFVWMVLSLKMITNCYRLLIFASVYLGLFYMVVWKSASQKFSVHHEYDGAEKTTDSRSWNNYRKTHVRRPYLIISGACTTPILTWRLTFRIPRHLMTIISRTAQITIIQSTRSSQCWGNAGPAAETLTQRCPDINWMTDVSNSELVSECLRMSYSHTVKQCEFRAISAHFLSEQLLL